MTAVTAASVVLPGSVRWHSENPRRQDGKAASPDAIARGNIPREAVASQSEAGTVDGPRGDVRPFNGASGVRPPRITLSKICCSSLEIRREVVHVGVYSGKKVIPLLMSFVFMDVRGEW